MMMFFIFYAVTSIKQKFTEMLNNVMLLLSTSLLVVTISFFTSRINWINESEMKPEEVRMSLQFLFMLFLLFQLVLLVFLVIGGIKTGELKSKSK